MTSTHLRAPPVKLRAVMCYTSSTKPNHVRLIAAMIINNNTNMKWKCPHGMIITGTLSLWIGLMKQSTQECNELGIKKYIQNLFFCQSLKSMSSCQRQVKYALDEQIPHFKIQTWVKCGSLSLWILKLGYQWETTSSPMAEMNLIWLKYLMWLSPSWSWKFEAWIDYVIINKMQIFWAALTSLRTFLKVEANPSS